MRLDDGFVVRAPIDEVFETLLDVGRVAPCVPGAKVLEHSDDGVFTVTIRVKVGPISMQYKASVEIVERDPAAHRAVMRVRAKETRGQGTAEATAELRLRAEGEETVGDIGVDVALSGKAASMGQGAIQDVSSKIVATFSKNLGAMLAAAPPEAPAATGGAGGGVAPEAPPAGAGSTAPDPAGSGAPASAAAPPFAAPVEDALSGADIVKAVIAGRLREPKVAGGLALVVGLVGFLLGRARPRR